MLPEAVQRRAEEAERIEKLMHGQPDPDGQDPNQEQPADNHEDPGDEGQDGQAAQGQQPEQPSSDGSQERPDDDESWKQRYRTLKGMYDAELPTLHAKIRELEEANRQLQADLERVRATPPEPETPANPITDRDREEFGEDLIELIERAAEAKTAPLHKRIAELEQQNQELRGRVGDVSEKVGKTSAETYLARLADAVPDWEEINYDPNFIEWLKVVDPVYGVERNVALQVAHKNLDVARVAAIFKAYKESRTPPTQPQKPAADLGRQVAPTRTRSGAPAQQQVQGKIWTNAEISQFFDDWRRGRIPQDEAERIEQDILAAQAQGRIRM